MQLQKAVQCDWILRSSYHFYVFDRLARNEQHARYKKIWFTSDHFLYKFCFILDDVENGMETATVRS